MNLRISGSLLICCLLLLLCNHYWINWEKYAQSSVEHNLLLVVLEQRNDLVQWARGNNTIDQSFPKRTLCKGRLENWSDDRPFEYDLSIDSIGIIENEHGVFLYQSLHQDNCWYYSAYTLYEFYSITNQYLKTKRGDKLTHHIKGISADGDYSFNDLLRYDIKPKSSPIIDALIGLVLVLVFLLEYIRLLIKDTDISW